MLLFVTLLAIFRLVALRARAEVLVDGHWLSALARAQRRMGFKHGTALLTSSDLNSPISWGLMRPVILLNDRAVDASDEAEAIIAHELAHVARMDWLKLLLARITTALFWFNPLVWILAREAHQLREETADDAVLAADIEDTSYAELLVGVARHDCPGMLLGAHGVAPSKKSLSRRIARVLDGAVVRGPAARSFALGVLAGAAIVSAPLAALTLVPVIQSADGKPTPEQAARSAYVASQPTDLGSLLTTGVTTSINSAVAAAVPAAITSAVTFGDDLDIKLDGQSAKAIKDAEEARRRLGPTVKHHGKDDEEDTNEHLVAMAALGVTPEYIAAMRRATPAFKNVEPSDLVSMKAVGVTPEYVREMHAAGIRFGDIDEIIEARAVGVTVQYVRSMKGAGIQGDTSDFAQLRAIGVQPIFVQRLRESGIDVSDTDEVTEMWLVGAKVSGTHNRRGPQALPRTSPTPPAPPAPPAIPEN